MDLTKLHRGRVQVQGVGMAAGIGGLGALAMGVMSPGDATWPWAVGICGNAAWAMANVLSAWMGNRENRDVNVYRGEVEDLRSRVENLERLVLPTLDKALD